MTNTSKIWQQLNKDHGGEAFFKASEPVRYKWEVFEYPCVALGSATGTWGVPRGTITQFHGAEGCGKTFLAMLMVHVAQQSDKDSDQVWIDTEDQANPSWLAWAKRLGIDLTRLQVIRSNSGVEIFTRLCGKVNKEGKKTIPGVFDLVMAGELKVSLIVLDSIADLQPPAEANRGFDEVEMAALARFMPRALRVLRPMLVKANTAMICINHLRDGMNGGQPSYPGGRGYRHNLDFAIKLHPCSGEGTSIEDQNGNKLGHKILATVEKTRGGVNKHKAEFWMDFRKGIVKQGEELAMLGAACGIVERPNNRNWVYGGKTTVGKDNFFAILDQDVSLRNEIFSKVKERRDAGMDMNPELTDVIQAEEVAEYSDEE